MNILLVSGAILALIGVTIAYPYQKRYDSMEATVDCYKYPSVMSYHVHVTYMLTNDDQIAQVSAFRDEAQAYFAPFLGPNPICQGTKEDPSGRYGKTLSANLFFFFLKITSNLYLIFR